MPEPDLKGAYALGSVDATKKLYADWAETYDTDFAAEMDFIAPTQVADAFIAAGGRGPVLDFGAGTGLLGVALAARGIRALDALDLSPEMLEIADAKGVYHRVIEGNLLDGLEVEDSYDGIVSSGTFTHGHVGPEALDALLAVARPGAQFALSVNAEHFTAAGFQQKLDALKDRVASLSLTDIPFYGPGATGPHKDDTGYILLFQRRGA